MSIKKANWLFLTVILMHFAIVAVLLFAGDRITLTITMNFLLSELTIVLPAILFLLLSRTKWNAALGFHKLKVSSVFMIILFTFLIMPLITVLNALSMFIVDNAVASMQGDILEISFPVMLFLIGIYGPFCEEFVFRGVIYNSFRKSGSVFWAIILSSLLFGLMHLNINQALYACVIGVLLALLVEATGSLWSSVVCHMVFNSQQVCVMFFYQWLQGTAYGKIMAQTETELTPQALLMALSVYLIIAAVTTPIAICILAWIAKNEKREDALRQIWKRRKEKREYLMSIPLIIAIVISLAYMSLELILN